MSLRASAHTGVAIRIPLRTLTTKLPKGERIATLVCALARNDIQILRRAKFQVVRLLTQADMRKTEFGESCKGQAVSVFQFS